MPVKRHSVARTLGIALFAILLTYTGMVRSIPSSITIFQGENADSQLKKLPGIELENDQEGMSVKWLGLFRLKKVNVSVVPDQYLMACGNVAGVKMEIDGLLVISLSDVEIQGGASVNPAKDAGIRTGDRITGAQGQELHNAQDLLGLVKGSNGTTLSLDVMRLGTKLTLEVKPERAAGDGQYHIGVWIRDSAAGIGTITYYDPETLDFGALGHGISDIDTKELVPLKRGKIFEAAIISIKKGMPGSPGELSGVFMEDWGPVGTVEENMECGIYGSLEPAKRGSLEGRPCPLGSPGAVREGNAVILSDIAGAGVTSYDVQILKIIRDPVSGKKSISLQVSDEDLLAVTGGIIQGMSGSPIIQDGRLVGAVTHVFVNDPQRGYGILIERMQ
ncbi:MAG TPA: SpoIVB peptidase [Clostridiales bacterium]|nr:SpoIVB peptidase [Clostridiales bacterium]